MTDLFPLHITSFLTEEELQKVSVPTNGWHRSVVIKNGVPRHSRMRTSRQRQLTSRHKLMKTIMRHIQLLGLSGTLPNNLQFSEDASLVKYEIGGRYEVHGDASGMTHGRTYTVLVCIQPADEGGETHFPNIAKKFMLKAGDALIWPNYLNGVENLNMDHEAMPVLRGVKIVVNSWFNKPE